MAAPYSGGVQVRIKGTLHGQDTVNVLNFATNTAVSDAGAAQTLLEALLAAVIACIIDTLLAAVTSDWTLTGVDGRYIFVNGVGGIGTDPIEGTLVDGPQPGEGGACSVSFASALVNIRTGQAGRSGRGKMFLPPPGEGNTTNSAMDGTATTAFQAFITCMVGKFIGAGATEDWRLGVLSTKLLAGSSANFNTAFHEATSMSLKNDLAVLSRRKKGHGR